jgi:hypothetical protein
LKRSLYKGDGGSTIATPTPLSANSRAVIKYRVSTVKSKVFASADITFAPANGH